MVRVGVWDKIRVGVGIRVGVKLRMELAVN